MKWLGPGRGRNGTCGTPRWQAAARFGGVRYDGAVTRPDDSDRIPLGLDDDPADDEDDSEALFGPDERDRDLVDGSWEQRYYSGQQRQRDWSSIGLAFAIVLILAMLLPGLLVVLR